jgi:uncharacterized protein YqcC (DUF446 family)
MNTALMIEHHMTARGHVMGDTKQRVNAMIGILDGIEAELRRIGRWREQRIDPHATLPPGEVFAGPGGASFADWLQFEFLPAARGALADENVPMRGLAGMMALRRHDDLADDPESQNLVRLLDDFGQALSGGEGS